MLALLFDYSSSDSDVSISKISKCKELARAISIELRNRFSIESRASDPSALVGFASSSHLEEITCNLD